MGDGNLAGKDAGTQTPDIGGQGLPKVQGQPGYPGEKLHRPRKTAMGSNHGGPP